MTATTAGKAPADRPGEEDLIRRFFAPIARHPGALGLADDAATLSVPQGQDLVLTKDTVVAGVHFFPDDPPGAIARKALRVNLSDLAAKGADPLGFLLSIALPDAWTVDWLAAFAGALGEDAETYRIPLLGGDTTRAAGPLVISITALGTLPSSSMVTRAKARPGDWIAVSGTIGDAALGLALRTEPRRKGFAGLSPEDRAFLQDRYLLPRPRTALAGAVRGCARAAMDISDGLAGDLAKLCAASGVSARVETALLPLSNAAHAVLDAEPALMERAVTGGDDYEILAVVSAERLDQFAALARAAGAPIAAIGEIVAGSGPPVLFGPDGRELKLAKASYSHF